MLLSDTVGFIRKLPHHLVEAFKATLEELSFADLLLHVIDASNEEWMEQAEVVDKLIHELGADHTPRIEVFNKCDRWQGEIRPHGKGRVSVSAKTGEGLDDLLKAIGGVLDNGARRVTIHLPFRDPVSAGQGGVGGVWPDHRRKGRVYPQDHRPAGSPGGGLAAPQRALGGLTGQMRQE